MTPDDDMPDYIIGYVPMDEDVPAHHLRDGFWFWRDGDEVVISDRKGVVHEVRVPLDEWASVLAHTSADGETGEKFAEARAFLEVPPHPYRFPGCGCRTCRTGLPPRFCPSCGNQTLGDDGKCRRESCFHGKAL